MMRPHLGTITASTDVTKLIPDHIPAQFVDGDTVWNRLFSDWFHRGMKSLDLRAKDGINERQALAHITALMGSWVPRHEIKEGAVAYLLSLWFEEPPVSKWEVA